MENIGIDVHKNESQICILTQTGDVLEQRIATRRERFSEVLGERGRARILIEASTESEWVARCLEELGHEVIVADPNFGPMYASRSRKVKTDRRDARALAEACQLGAYRPAHRTSDAQRDVRGRLLSAGCAGEDANRVHLADESALATARSARGEWCAGGICRAYEADGPFRPASVGSGTPARHDSASQQADHVFGRCHRGDQFA